MRKVAVVVTALPVEYAAVREHVKNLVERQDEHGTIYEVGRVADWEVWLAEIGAGNVNAAARVERLLAFMRPSPTIALFVAVAGGIKDVHLGDVVAATKVYGYESGKDVERRFLSRPDLARSTYRMIELARAAARKFTSSLIHLGPIAAGEKVVAGNRTATAEFIRIHYGDAVAVEMEGRGFLAALDAHRNVEALVVRGISDLLSGKRKADAAGWQRIASKNAAEFVFRLLRRYARQNIDDIERPEIPTAPVRKSPLAARYATEKPTLWHIELEGSIADLTAIELKDIYDGLQHVLGHATVMLHPVSGQRVVLTCEASVSDQVRQSLNIPESSLVSGFRILSARPALRTETFTQSSVGVADNGIQWHLQNIVEREVRRPSPHSGEPKESENRDERISELVERGELKTGLARRVRGYFRSLTYRHPINLMWRSIGLAAEVRRQRLTQWLEEDFEHHIIWHHRSFDIGNVFAAIAVQAPAFDYEHSVFVRAATTFNEESRERYGNDSDKMPLIPLVHFIEILEYRAQEISRAMRDPTSSLEWIWPSSWGEIHFTGPILSFASYPAADQQDPRVDLDRLHRSIVRYRTSLGHKNGADFA